LIDFGSELGTKKSLAKLAPNYTGAELIGRQILAVVNFPPRQIGKHLSEVLTLACRTKTATSFCNAPTETCRCAANCI